MSGSSSSPPAPPPADANGAPPPPSQGANLDATSAAKITSRPAVSALCAAIKSKQHDELRALLARGADPNGADLDGVSLIEMATSEGDRTAVEALAAAGADPLGRAQPPLLIAAERNSLDLVELFVRTLGVDVNCTSRFSALLGVSALHCAVRAGHADAVRLLLSLGANPNARTLPAAGAETPLHLTNVLVSPVRERVMRLLLDHGADPNRGDATGRTPLHYFANSSKTKWEALRMLLAAKSRVNSVTSDGRTPLLVAASALNQETVCILLEHGADPNLATPAYSPLAYCVKSGLLRAAEALIACGAMVDYLNNEGASPLHIAVGSGAHALASLLVECGADPALPRGDGETALSLARRALRSARFGGTPEPTLETFLQACAARVKVKIA